MFIHLYSIYEIHPRAVKHLICISTPWRGCHESSWLKLPRNVVEITPNDSSFAALKVGSSRLTDRWKLRTAQICVKIGETCFHVISSWIWEIYLFLNASELQIPLRKMAQYFAGERLEKSFSWTKSRWLNQWKTLELLLSSSWCLEAQMKSGQMTKFRSPHLGFVTVILQGAVYVCMVLYNIIYI